MKAILLLGSNLDNPLIQLRIATKQLSAFVNVLRCSSVYVTAAWGKTDQADFYNQALEIEFEASPSVLMKKIIEIERLMGRERINKWEPRIIDIDIICIEDLIIRDELLSIPHPYMQDRMFVLKPFEELTDAWEHPVLKLNVKELILKCTDKLQVHRLTIE
jgi:2-amino-4-hydroxy-6-hydroxymethyldihydropteridine diphosphokinase